MEMLKMRDCEYHAIKDRCSASALKTLRRSPAHMKLQQDEPKESDSMALGSLFHCQLWEPEDFSNRYIRVAKIDKRTKEYKEAASTGLIVIDQETSDAAWNMTCSAKDHSKAGKIITAAQFVETVILFEINGVPCKAKIDAYALESVIDAKSTKDASPESFQRDFVKYGYHIQGAFYRRAMLAMGLPCKRFIIIATENDKPHLTAVYELSENALKLGDQIIDKLLPVWWDCQQRRTWPGYPESVTILDLPAWELKNLDDKPAIENGIVKF